MALLLTATVCMVILAPPPLSANTLALPKDLAFFISGWYSSVEHCPVSYSRPGTPVITSDQWRQSLTDYAEQLGWKIDQFTVSAKTVILRMQNLHQTGLTQTVTYTMSCGQ